MNKRAPIGHLRPQKRSGGSFSAIRCIKSGEIGANSGARDIVVVEGLCVAGSLLNLGSTYACGAKKFWCYVDKILDAFGHSY